MSDAQLTHPVNSSAERMRVHRERRRDGWRYVGLLVHDREVAELVRRGLLAEEEQNDPVSIAEALGPVLDEVLER